MRQRLAVVAPHQSTAQCCLVASSKSVDRVTHCRVCHKKVGPIEAPAKAAEALGLLLLAQVLRVNLRSIVQPVIRLNLLADFV